MAKRKKQTRAHDFTPATRKRIEDQMDPGVGDP